MADAAPDGGAWTDEQVAALLSDWLGEAVPPAVAHDYLPRRRRKRPWTPPVIVEPRRFAEPLPLPIHAHRLAYPSDLSDAEWVQAAPLVEPREDSPRHGGRPCRWSKREILDALFYLVRSGESWRMLPHDLPPWPTVYYWLRRWRLDGTWEQLNDVLRERVRQAAGREPEPSAAILDSQSAKTTEKGGRAGTTRARRSTAASATCWSMSSG